jgi:hypothetical protein
MRAVRPVVTQNFSGWRGLIHRFMGMMGLVDEVQNILSELFEAGFFGGKQEAQLCLDLRDAAELDRLRLLLVEISSPDHLRDSLGMIQGAAFALFERTHPCLGIPDQDVSYPLHCSGSDQAMLGLKAL